VLFNPKDSKRLHKCLKSAADQKIKIYVFDNSTIDCVIQFQQEVEYISENGNRGIAYALNAIMEKAESDGYEWLITMDQDSILPTGLIDAYENHLKDEQIGIICPQVIDSRRSYMKIKKEPKEEWIDFCITSASCTRISAWNRIGKYDEWLFIDLVDNDFCKRLTASGYKILRLNEYTLDQKFGDITPKSEKAQSFWNCVARIFHNDNFGKFGYKKRVSPTRVYYTCRNVIYVNRKLKCFGKTGYRENYNCNGYPGFLISFIIPSVLRAQEKKKVIRAVIKGTAEGKRCCPEIWRKGL